jgi:antitoxin component YwqK of YwqJK toxin-antitoxin module
MASKKASAKQELIYHKDGSLWAKGKTVGGVFTGYWEWFRKDGTRLRSGHFERGQQAGEWITYDKEGKKWKVTNIEPKAKKRAS